MLLCFVINKINETKYTLLFTLWSKRMVDRDGKLPVHPVIIYICYLFFYSSSSPEIKSEVSQLIIGEIQEI